MRMSSLSNWYTSLPNGAGFLLAFLLLCVCSLWAAVGLGYYLLAGVPVVVLLAFLAIADFKQLYWLLLAMIPFSTEVVLPNGFGTDLPTEPIMVGLLIIFAYHLLSKLPTISLTSWRHPLVLALILHLSWTLLTTVMSDLLFVSIKFSLAKLWYVVSFFLLTYYLLRSEKDFRRFFWVFYLPYLLVAFIIFCRHAWQGFDFMHIHSVMHPFHRNHVNYAALLSLFYPFIVLMLPSVPRYSKRWWLLLASLVFLLAGIYFSYTRAAYAALFIAAGAYYVIRWRLFKPVLWLASIAALLGVAYFVQDNTYLDYAPNFERTVSHEKF
ncbi:MAG: O-antigen ligase family protein, partial [Bacteroidetes bacterium]